MTIPLENGRPRLGDLVQMDGLANAPVMEVVNPDLGDEHFSEGVANGILCFWTVDGVEQHELFRPGQLVIVERPDQPSSSTKTAPSPCMRPPSDQIG
jgi:hypothetical protein